MKIRTVEKIQYLNAFILLVFCMLYSALNYRISLEVGLVGWGVALIFLYSPNLLTCSELSDEMIIAGKKISICASWFQAFFFLGLWSGNNSLKLASLLPLTFLIIFGVNQWKNYKNEGV